MSPRSTRCFTRFGCRITIEEFCAGTTKTSEITTEFICAYCLRQLVACCRPFTYTPKRWCQIHLDFYIIEPSVDIHSLPLAEYNNFVVHNYEQINSRIIRATIFTLVINDFAHEDELQGFGGNSPRS